MVTAAAQAAAPSAVTFSVKQSGPSGVPGQGAGTTSVMGSVAKGGSYRPSLPSKNASFGKVTGGVISHRDAQGTLRLEVLGGFDYLTQPGGTQLNTDVKVLSSTDPGCAVGSRGLFQMFDVKGGGDQLQMNVCNHAHVYTHGEKGGSVVISLRGGAAPPPTTSTDVTQAQAITLVEEVLRKHAKACQLAVVRLSATRTPFGWRVSAFVRTFGNLGESKWSVVRGKVTPADPLAADITNNCP